MLTATFDGKTLTLYKDGDPIAKRNVKLSDDSEHQVNIGESDPWDHKRSFHGEIRAFSIRRGALSRDQVRQLFDKSNQNG